MKIKLFFAAAIVFATVAKTQAKVIVDGSSKFGGILGIWYDYVSQTPLGTDADGNSHYNLFCRNPGSTRCRVHSTQGVGLPPRDTEIGDMQQLLLNNQLDRYQEEVYSGNINGSITKTHLVTLSDGSTISIYIKVNWSPDLSDPGAFKFHAEVWNSEE
jgi:hypothetical protein